MEQTNVRQAIINEINESIKTDPDMQGIRVVLDTSPEQILGQQLYTHFNLQLLKRKRKVPRSYMLPITTIYDIEVYVEIETILTNKYVKSLNDLLDDSESEDSDEEKTTTIRLTIRSHLWIDYSTTKSSTTNKTLPYYNQKLVEGVFCPELYVSASALIFAILPKLTFNKILSRFTTNMEDYFICTSQYVRHDTICDSLYEAFNQNQSTIIVDMDICSICRDKTRISIAHCAHYVCIPCLDKLNKSTNRNRPIPVNKCPICRVDFFPTEIYNGLYDEYVAI